MGNITLYVLKKSRKPTAHLAAGLLDYNTIKYIILFF